jgi:putative phosphoesterase
MKALILSDIHANIYALRAIWAREQDADLILCTGDLVDYGPSPREVIAWIRSHDVICTQGNHDAWVAQTYRNGAFPATLPPAAREWRHVNAGLLDDADIAFLEGLPHATTVAIDDLHYGLTHLYVDYTIIDSTHGYRTFCAERFGVPLPRLIMGHTHRQGVYHLRDDLLWLNPGSVSYRRPDDPDQTAHYATIVDGCISLRQVDYDRTELFQLVDRTALAAAEAAVTRWFFGPRVPGEHDLPHVTTDQTRS